LSNSAFPEMSLAPRSTGVRRISYPAPRGTGPGTSRRGLMFVVDQDAASRRLMERALSNAGHSVETFSNADSLLSSLKKATPTAIFIDQSLPGLSGVQAVALIRAQSSAIRVVIVSVDKDIRGVVQAVRAGAFDYLTKPLHSETLVQCAKEAVSQASARSSSAAALEDSSLTLDELEKRAIHAALHRAQGNVTKAMRQLGIGRTTLYRKLKRYGLR